MSTFMFLLSDNPANDAALSPEALEALLARYMAWTSRMAQEGRLRGGEKLRDEGGRLLTNEAGHVVVRDGPYAELREVVSGYFLIEAADYDEAVAIARTCPHAERPGSMQIREIEVLGPPEA
jgi:hypothetical protein